MMKRIFCREFQSPSAASDRELVMIFDFPSVTPSGYHGTVIKATPTALTAHCLYNNVKFHPARKLRFTHDSMVKQLFLLVTMALMICSLPMASAVQGKLTYAPSKRNQSLNLVSPPGATCIILKLPTWYIINDTSASITTFGDANCQEVLRIIISGEEWETQMSDEPVVAIVFHREN